MKITKSYLKQLILEEVERKLSTVNEATFDPNKQVKFPPRIDRFRKEDDETSGIKNYKGAINQPAKPGIHPGRAGDKAFHGSKAVTYSGEGSTTPRTFNILRGDSDQLKNDLETALRNAGVSDPNVDIEGNQFQIRFKAADKMNHDKEDDLISSTIVKFQTAKRIK